MKYRILAALLPALLCAIGVAQNEIGPATTSAPAASAPAASAPAAAPTTQPLSATVKEITGLAQQTTVPPEPEPDFELTWNALEVDDRLGERSLIRTGFRTRVVLAMADNSEVIIDKATKVGIAEFCKVGETTRTRLGLKYGSIRANVERARGPNDFRVATPVAVFAVTGTKGWIGISADHGFTLLGERGSWATRSGAKHRNTRGLEQVNQTFLRNIYLVQAAHNPFLVGPGLTPAEKWSLFLYGGGRGIIGFGGAGQGGRRVLFPPSPCYSYSPHRHDQVGTGYDGPYTAR